MISLALFSAVFALLLENQAPDRQGRELNVPWGIFQSSARFAPFKRAKFWMRFAPRMISLVSNQEQQGHFGRWTRFIFRAPGESLLAR
jgi:hypothetical protein